MGRKRKGDPRYEFRVAADGKKRWMLKPGMDKSGNNVSVNDAISDLNSDNGNRSGKSKTPLTYYERAKNGDFDIDEYGLIVVNSDQMGVDAGLEGVDIKGYVDPEVGEVTLEAIISDTTNLSGDGLKHYVPYNFLNVDPESITDYYHDRFGRFSEINENAIDKCAKIDKLPQAYEDQLKENLSEILDNRGVVDEDIRGRGFVEMDSDGENLTVTVELLTNNETHETDEVLTNRAERFANLFSRDKNDRSSHSEILDVFDVA